MTPSAAIRTHKKPMPHRFLRLPFRAALLAAAASCAGSVSRAAEPLDELAATRQLCRAGATAALARAERQVGEAGVTAASVLPNPALVIQDQRSLSGPTERETVVGASFALSLNGRRSLLKRAAQAHRDEANATAHATLFEAALAFREAYLTAQLDQAEADILAQQQSTLESVAEAIQALARGGEAAGHDLLRQRTQTQIHRARLEAARSRALASHARLQAWLDAEFALPAFDPAKWEASPPAAALADSDAARLQSLEASARASALMARAAGRRWFPDPELFAGYREVAVGGETARGWSLSLSLPLTVFDHGQGEAAQAAAQQELASSTATALRRQNQAEIQAALARWAQLSSALAEIARASSSSRALEAQAQRLYAAGESSIGELLETFRQAEDARLTQLDLARQFGSTRLSLMQATGSMFDSTLNADCGGKGVR